MKDSKNISANLSIKRVRKILIIWLVALIAGYSLLKWKFDSDPHKSQLMEFVKSNGDVQAAAGAIQDVDIPSLLQVSLDIELKICVLSEA